MTELKSTIAETGISLDEFRKRKKKLKIHLNLKIKVEGGIIPLPLDKKSRCKSLSGIENTIKESLKDIFGYEKHVYFSLDEGYK